MEIVEAKVSDLESFFTYLETQLLDNAAVDSPLFQPIAKEDCHVSARLKVKFREGFEPCVGELGWRKLWLLKDAIGNILGHVDLRHYGEEYRYHRVLLGMGVDSSVRKQGFGQQLIESAIQFCHETFGIDWLDLNVLSNNVPAKNLYLKLGFEEIGQMIDCYRIDGQSVSETTMTLCIKKHTTFDVDT